MAKKELTDKQQAFVEYYCNNGFNAAAAYKIAYPLCKAGHNKLGSRLMANDGIKQAIALRKAEIKAESIATRKQRQQFWTDTMLNERPGTVCSMADRLRASELLGKSEADFTAIIDDRRQDQPAELSEVEQKAVAEAARLFKLKVARKEA